ncbi:hypothetical protein DFH06DRAFT_1132120 [Mycena polygramma]|nr:hypothetical protein DFH06DRAFT_1132120 [Mycena polygramma]
MSRAVTRENEGWAVALAISCHTLILGSRRRARRSSAIPPGATTPNPGGPIRAQGPRQAKLSVVKLRWPFHDEILLFVVNFRNVRRISRDRAVFYGGRVSRACTSRAPSPRAQCGDGHVVLTGFTPAIDGREREHDVTLFYARTTDNQTLWPRIYSQTVHYLALTEYWNIPRRSLCEEEESAVRGLYGLLPPVSDDKHILLLLKLRVRNGARARRATTNACWEGHALQQKVLAERVALAAVARPAKDGLSESEN